jgi:hypothetical protein
MTTDIARKILGYIGSNKQAKVVDLVRDLGLSNVAIHKQLNKLMEQGKITRVGKPPLVFYILNKQTAAIPTDIPQDLQEFIDNTYVYVSPVGEYLIGTEGFIRWAQATNQDKQLLPLAQEYVTVRKEVNLHRSANGWIVATQAKVGNTFHDTVLNKMLYQDFYSIEKFGKTKLGQMVLYAKISQNKQIIESITEQIRPTIETMLQVYNIVYPAKREAQCPVDD